MKNTISLITFLTVFLIFNLNVSAQKIGQTELKAAIAGVSSGEISKDNLLSSANIQCTDTQYEIINFNLSMKKNSDIVDFYGKGNQISVVMKDLIKEMETGDKLVIEKISAKSQKGVIIDLPAIVLVVK